MKRYCLANYILSIDIPLSISSQFGTTNIQIGGEGSYTDTISIDRPNNLFETEGDTTGSWVHVKNLNATGTITVSIKQVSDKVAKFKTLCNIYANVNTEVEGLTLTLRDTLNNTIAICDDCLIQKIPTQEFSSAPGNQSWVLTCGKITFID